MDNRRRWAKWRCSECGCTYETAQRRRARAGLGPVQVHARTCTPKCRLRRIRRLAAAKWRRLKKMPVPEPHHGPGWHCSECGADLDQANEKRRRLGLRPLHSAKQVVCSPACLEVRRIRRYAARWGAPPRPLKGRRRDPTNWKWL